MAYTTINKSTEHFNTKIYTGNGSTQSITGVGFQPDFCWFKRRDTGASNHALQDAVRGVTKFIQSNTTAAEATSSNYLTSFNSDGFSLAGDGDVNENNANHVAWNWKANGSGSANTTGSINSTVSVNTTSGFSIVSYTGTGANATVGHGLGSVPKMIILKSRNSTDKPMVYHVARGNDNSLSLDRTDYSTGNSQMFNSTTPTSSVFSLGTSGNTNGGSQNFIAYCFADVVGYQKSSSYIGNGSSSSPTFIYTGFKPKFVIVKNMTQADSWFMHDDKRDGYNDDNEYLRANETSAEGSGINRIRLLSNGFQVPTTDKSHNVSGNIYVYYAVGQSIVGGTGAGVPCTAR